MNILITCEGVCTEPNYFQALIGELALQNVFTSIMGKGESSTKLIRDTIRLRDAYAADEGHPLVFDEVWAVFDRDDNEDFNTALHLARQNGIRCAWSNESIELWFLLHFEFVNTNNGRKWYIHKLNTVIRELTGNPRFKYRKNSTAFYKLLRCYGDERRAARWSRQLEALYADNDFAHHDPCTTVYRLVERLRWLHEQENYNVYMKTVRRGYVDKDEQLFGGTQRDKILSAADDARWLMNRGYSAEPAITFTSNHYLLSSRQRMAIFRSIISDEDLRERKTRELQAPGEEVFIDGLNTIITLETALSRSVVLCGDDGAMRDVAGLHGTYRLIDKTPQAISLIMEALKEWQVRKATFLLDKPVSNSGALKQLIEKLTEGSPVKVAVKLDANPDALLAGKEHVITSDGPVIQKSASWFNLNACIVREKIHDAWVFDFKKKTI